MASAVRIAALAEAARLDLPAEREAVAAALLDVVARAAEALETIDLEAFPPALSFDARWE